MENLGEWLGGGAFVAIGVLAYKVASLGEEVRSLRSSRHEYGNKFAAYDVEIGSIKRRLEKMGNGEK